MGAMLLPSRFTQQPQQLVPIDSTNLITAGLQLALSHADQAQGSRGGMMLTQPYIAAAIKGSGPTGTSARAGSSTSYLYELATANLTGNSYTILVVAFTSDVTSTLSPIDDDNSVTRKFQFRLAAGKADIIPFNGTPAVTGQATFPAAMTAAEAARGFVIGATVAPGASTVWQNGQKATGAPVSPAALSGSIRVGGRKAGNQGWNSGGISLVLMWNRALNDAEMQSLSANPWQVFKAPSRNLWYAASAAPASAIASMAWTEADDTSSSAATVTNRGAAAWTEGDDAATAAGLVTDRAAVTWTEAGDSMAMTGTAAVPAQGQTGATGALAWIEAGDTAAAIGVVVDRASLAWTEQDDAWTMTGQPATPPSTTLSVRFDTLARDYGITTTYFSN